MRFSAPVSQCVCEEAPWLPDALDLHRARPDSARGHCLDFSLRYVEDGRRPVRNSHHAQPLRRFLSQHLFGAAWEEAKRASKARWALRRRLSILLAESRACGQFVIPIEEGD